MIFPSGVARWDATFCSFRGIGRGGTASPSEVFAGTGAPAAYDMRGGNAPSALPTSGRSAPPPRVTFVSRRKSPKACQGRCPWTPLGGIIIPPAARRAAPPQKGEGATKGSWICHFEVVRAIGISFSRSSVEETPAAFKPWRGDYRCRMCRLCRFCVKFVSGNLA